MKKLLLICLIFPLHAVASSPINCSAGILNVVKFGANGTAAGDTAAFQAAYTAATTPTSGCYNVPIFVPGKNTKGWQGKPWPGHWPVFTKPVTIEGAGANLTNFSGDTTGWPVFWVQAPNVKLSSFGFWGSPAVDIKLDVGSNGAVLNHIGCRSSSQIFVYAGGISNVTMTGLTSISCGNSATADPLAGGSIVIYNSSNVTVNAFESFGAPNWSIVVAGSQNVAFNGGKTDYGDAFGNNTKAQVVISSSSVTMNNGFYFAGTNYYELFINGNSTFTGKNLVFSGGSNVASDTPNIYYAPTSVSTFTCSNCVFQDTYASGVPGWMSLPPAAFQIDTTAAITAAANILTAFSPSKTILTLSSGQTLSVSKKTAPYQLQVAN